MTMRHPEGVAQHSAMSPPDRPAPRRSPARRSARACRAYVQGAGEGIEDGGAGAGLLAVFQAHAEVDADAGEGGQLLAGKPGVRRMPAPTVRLTRSELVWVRRARREAARSAPSLFALSDAMTPVSPGSQPRLRREGGPVITPEEPALPTPEKSGRRLMKKTLPPRCVQASTGTTWRAGRE